jgi:signal transduction histidine kinase/ActR/RegA family two-component response regulator
VPTPSNSPSAPPERSVILQSLEAQSALLHYALALFAVCLPVFVWAASFAQNAAWMAATFAIFAINWAAFYAAVNWVKTEGKTKLRRRLLLHIMGGLLWAGAVAQVAAMANFAGPTREILLMMAAAGAAACIFFSAPVLPALLIVGPAAAAAPLIALFSRPGSQDEGVIAAGALAFAMTLGLILNRLLRSQFTLAAEREELATQNAASLERAERLARSKSDIVSTLSHEIRNGLNGVTQVLAAAVGQNGRAAPSREQMIAALDAAHDLIGVLNATLDSETADAGRLTFDVQAFDLARLVRDQVVLHRPQAAARGVEFNLHVDPELEKLGAGAAMGDVTRTRQVLANLIGNAVKYTLRGRIEARIELRGENRIAVEIADTGPGLSPEELERAFEPFRRVERTGAGVPGAGLGLSLARRLAGLMGGELTGQSAVGVGSCFTLIMPFDPAAMLETMDVLEAVNDGKRLKVLIAEDDGLNAAMLRAILEQLGHQVVHAQNGRRALDLARTIDFDLVMLDGRMPHMDGAQTAAALRAMEGAASRAPIIGVIGGDADEARECLEAGADAVLRKPVTVGAVARAVADATSPRKPGKGAGKAVA